MSILAKGRCKFGSLVLTRTQSLLGNFRVHYSKQNEMHVPLFRRMFALAFFKGLYVIGRMIVVPFLLH